jgi:hypothetical protein
MMYVDSDVNPGFKSAVFPTSSRSEFSHPHLVNLQVSMESDTWWRRIQVIGDLVSADRADVPNPFGLS